MNRRTREQLSPQKVIDDVVFSSLDWPWKTVRLERDTLQDYCQRLTSPIFSVAELYHENSKLFPQRLSDLTATRVDSYEVRRKFLQRRSSAMGDAPQVDLAPEYRQMLSGVIRAIPEHLFYAIELRLATDSTLLFHEPLSDKLQLLKQISAEEGTRLRKALRLLVPSGEQEHFGPVLFVVANFARNDLLFGSRGYRLTLIEAGRVTEGLLGVAREVGVAVGLRTEFGDRDLDLLLEADGVEEGVLVAMELAIVNDDS